MEAGDWIADMAEMDSGFVLILFEQFLIYMYISHNPV